MLDLLSVLAVLGGTSSFSLLLKETVNLYVHIISLIPISSLLRTVLKLRNKFSP